GVAVTPAAPTSIAVVPLHNVVAGTTQDVLVTARDPFGNVAPAYTGTVAFSSSDTIATLPAAYTFTAADAGAHTFAVTYKSAGGHALSFALKTAGTQSITATDSVDAGLAGGISSVLVKAAAARNLVATLPSSTTAGVAQPLTVTATDAYGNVTTGYTGTVSFG